MNLQKASWVIMTFAELLQTFLQTFQKMLQDKLEIGSVPKSIFNFYCFNNYINLELAYSISNTRTAQKTQIPHNSTYIKTRKHEQQQVNSMKIVLGQHTKQSKHMYFCERIQQGLSCFKIKLNTQVLY